MNTEELISSLAGEAGKVKPATCPLTFLAWWMLAVAIYIVCTSLFLNLRPDLLSRLASPLFLAEILALLAMVISSSLASCVLSFPDLHQMRKWLLAPAFSCASFLAIIVMAWLADSPPAPEPVHAIECLICISLLSFFPSVALLQFMRGYASTNRQMAGSMAMLSAFSIGALTLRLCEQTDSISHLVQWHYLPMFVVAALGAWLGKIILKW
ncbi:MAG: DUF1109 domain-containing protein [Alphaproteobacteria bacterium]|nr:DUF1109 domain-containing protein [Alphaproteobacteria bacterium]